MYRRQEIASRDSSRDVNLRQLLCTLETSEHAFVANSQTADRVEADQGSIAARWMRAQAAALKFQPDPTQMPGIDRIEILCDVQAGGTGLTAANVRQLRARICWLKGCSLQEADAYSLVEAADVLAATMSPTESALVAKSGDDASIALLRVFTNGLADDRIEKATRLLSNAQLNANEKLTKIDALMPFPATASAEQLGEMLGVTKQAVLKTDWWIQNRRGEKENEIGRRRAVQQKRAKDYEPPSTNDDRQ
jgi:hypothetical protein